MLLMLENIRVTTSSGNMWCSRLARTTLKWKTYRIIQTSASSHIMHCLYHYTLHLFNGPLSGTTWVNLQCFAFSALTLFVGHQEGHSVCTKFVWRRAGMVICLSEVQIICTWSSWCHCHPIISCFSKIQNGSAFLVPAYPACPGKERGH